MHFWKRTSHRTTDTRMVSLQNESVHVFSNYLSGQIWHFKIYTLIVCRRYGSTHAPAIYFYGGRWLRRTYNSTHSPVCNLIWHVSCKWLVNAVSHKLQVNRLSPPTFRRPSTIFSDGKITPGDLQSFSLTWESFVSISTTRDPTGSKKCSTSSPPSFFSQIFLRKTPHSWLELYKVFNDALNLDWTTTCLIAMSFKLLSHGETVFNFFF